MEQYSPTVVVEPLSSVAPDAGNCQPGKVTFGVYPNLTADWDSSVRCECYLPSLLTLRF